MQFAHFDIDHFLRTHWQKTPALIRNPWTAWRNPLEPDELAGLACEEGVESRLVMAAGDRLAMESGPLPETRFGDLGRDRWTLLVQAVDQHVPDVAALIDPFRFVPDWRIDDVMVSYASDGGGVGAHFDQYDVFLVQGLGRRRWRVGPRCDSATPLLPHDDLRLIADFEATDEWVLEPGDILYVPPCFAHDGVADRYADPDLVRQDHPGEIAASAIDRLHGLVLEALSDRATFARWFGAYSSQPKYADTDWQPEEPADVNMARALIAAQVPLCRNPASRFAFMTQADDAVTLFVDGQSFDCVGDGALLARALCGRGDLMVDPALAGSDTALTLIAALIDQGSVAFDEGE